MAIVDLFALMAGLWLASSVLALLALTALYVAERARERRVPRRSEAERAGAERRANGVAGT